MSWVAIATAGAGIARGIYSSRQQGRAGQQVADAQSRGALAGIGSATARGACPLRGRTMKYYGLPPTVFPFSKFELKGADRAVQADLRYCMSCLTLPDELPNS